MATFRSHVLVCGGTGCTSGGSDKVLETLREGIKANGLDKEITVVQTGCHGMCEAGPIVIVYPEGTFYTHIKPQDAKEIVAEHLLKGRVVERLLYKEAMHSEAVPHYKELPFYSKQVRLTLRNCGYIDPDSLEEYLARDGYQALAKVLTEKTPEQVVEDIKASGLRGRGGGGFSTGMKWMFCAKSPGPKKYVICNADEGDPGAFMDRSLLEGDPHAILEGMAIGAYAMGADEGYIYCRAEYPLAIKRLLKSITDAEEAGLLGENILGTGFNFTLHVKEGAGAFVCGEETALMNSIEGKRGMPRPRPPFPAIKGLWEKPSNINNVETWANVAQIMFHGPEWYANYGYDKSRGTKVFALTGKVNNTGLVEVPMGTTIREVVFDIGGGIIGGKKFKAVQTSTSRSAMNHLQLRERSWVRADWSLSTKIHAWSTWPGSSLNSHSANPAENASPAAKAPKRCSTSSSESPKARDAKKTSKTSFTLGRRSRLLPSAALARQLPTRCLRPCATSGTNMRRT